MKTALSSVLSCVPDDEERNLLLMEKTLMALSDLLKELLVKDMTVKTFDVLLQVVITIMIFLSTLVYITVGRERLVVKCKTSECYHYITLHSNYLEWPK